ncbi:hypothetical protein HPB50_000585 [Hyalomma asiaticum]|uniref:Uncharacterized protein n=1 Tax=Hyalomma asiaticum TaxID=266040 RepID=A0ACB7TCP4_HYAAI|nr:hypothetical protein HPB50_000585 [Hyalomma asiaticum]
MNAHLQRLFILQVLLFRYLRPDGGGRPGREWRAFGPPASRTAPSSLSTPQPLHTAPGLDGIKQLFPGAGFPFDAPQRRSSTCTLHTPLRLASTHARHEWSAEVASHDRLPWDPTTASMYGYVYKCVTAMVMAAPRGTGDN